MLGKVVLIQSYLPAIENLGKCWYLGKQIFYNNDLIFSDFMLREIKKLITLVHWHL